MKNTVILAVVLGLMVSGCNRGALRFHGVGSDLPPANTQFIAQKTHPESLFIAVPEDHTEQYLGVSVDGTSWQGTQTDTFSKSVVLQIVHNELVREISSARLFKKIESEKSAGDLVLETEMRAFGAQVRGFIIARIGGVSAFKFTLKRDGKVVFEQVYEEVVKDGDSDYTGSSVGFIEDGMRATMSDSFREVLKDFFKDLEGLSL